MKTKIYTALVAAILLTGCDKEEGGAFKLTPPLETVIPVKAEIVIPLTPTDMIVAAERAANDSVIDAANALIDTYLEQVNVNQAYEVVNVKWTGDEKVRNRIFATILTKKIAEKWGDSRAVYMAGFAHYKGKGVDKDYDVAISYFNHKTQLDNAGVMYYMADMLLDEAYAGYNEEEGLRFLRSAAVGGYQDAIDRMKSFN